MGKFDGDRLKTQLKLVKCRLENLLKQHQNTSGGRRREIANLLQQGHEDRARVNVKYLIRDDYLMEAYEMLLTCCDDLIQSAGLVAREKTLEPDLIIPTKSLLYAAGRIEAPELDRIKDQFEAKYGKSFVDVNSEVGKASVDPSLVVKLSIRSPDAKLVDRYMLAIAQIFNVPWKAPEEPLLDETVNNNSTCSQPSSQQLFASIISPIQLPSVKSFEGGVSSAPPPPYSPVFGHVPPGQLLPSSPPDPPNVAASTSPAPDFEELTRRFQALKDGKR